VSPPNCCGIARTKRGNGRARLASEAREGSAGAGYALSAGAVSGITTEMYRALSIDSARRATIAGLGADARRHSAGYTLVSWVGATPPEHMAGAVSLSNAMADAPRDAHIEPEIWDADRIRAAEQVEMDHGWQLYAVAAQHDATGVLAAITQIAASPTVPSWASST
jgi:hypothetical protein